METEAPQPQLGAAGAAQPQLGAAGAAQPQLGAAGAAQPQLGAAGAAQPQLGAGAGQHFGAGAGQHGAGAGAQHDGAPLHLLAILALILAINPPPLHPASFLACNLASRPSRPPHPPQSADATDPKLTAKAAKASDANRTVFIKIFLPRELNMDPRNATMYFLSYGPNLPETSLALRAAVTAEFTFGADIAG